MNLVAALGRIDDIQSRIRALSGDPVPAAATTEASATASAGVFASALEKAGGAFVRGDGQVTGDDIVARAQSYLGVPYVFGGEDASGMDCSGLVQRVLADLGVDAPRVVQDQADIGVAVPSLAQAQPGDLIVEKGEGHIVIYAGDGKIIHAPSPGKFVELRDNYLKDSDIATIRRVVPSGAEAAAASAAAGAAAASSAAASAATAGAAGAVPFLASLGVSRIVSPAPAAASTIAATAAPAAAPAVATAATAPAGESLVAALSPTARTATPGHARGEDAVADRLAVTPSPAPLRTDAAAAPRTDSVPSGARSTPFAPQVTAPVLSLVRAPDGEHTVTVRVSPENLGPVTVTAHISRGAIAVELGTVSDAGRDALRAILVDLRRDLAALAPMSSITLSPADPNAPGSGSASGQWASGQSGPSGYGASSFAPGSGSGSGGGGAGTSGHPGERMPGRADAGEIGPVPALDPTASAPGAGIDLFV